MIRTLLLFSIAFFAVLPLTKAQDLSISHINHIELSAVKGGATKYVSVMVRVNETVSSNATFNVLYAIDGGAMSTGAEDWPVMDPKVGQLLPPVRCQVPFSKNYNDTVKLTVVLDFDDDKDATNDTAHIRFIIREKVANDLKVTLMSPAPGSELLANKTHEFIYSIKNVGTTPLTYGTQLLEYVTMNGQFTRTPSFDPYPGDSMKPGDSLVSHVYFTFPNLQQGEEIEVCQSVFWAELTDTSLNTIEGNHSDNTSCATFNVLPNSLNDITTASILQSLRLSSGTLQFTAGEAAIGQNTHIQLLEATGKVYLDKELTLQPGAHQYMLPPLSQGIYFVQLHIEGKTPVVYKTLYRP